MSRVVYPFGVLWARVMPTRQFNTCGIKWTLNTGPFNIKEHAVITVSIKNHAGITMLTVLQDHGRNFDQLRI
jgi:hypothetical protein